MSKLLSSIEDSFSVAFRKSLAEKRPILLSGPTGSVLYERGIFINKSFEEVNLSQPELVMQIHNEYIQAGAQIVGTNTWAANLCKLKPFGLENKVREINLAGAKLAKKAAHDNSCFVAGVLGPLGVRIEPWGPTSLDEAKEFFKAQITPLIEGGVDLFLLESFADLFEIQQAIYAIKEICNLPIITMMEVNEEGQSLYGTEVSWFAKKLDEWGADVIGISGGNGPAPILEIVEKLNSVTKKPLVLYPHAGQPRLVDGRLIYMTSPEYMGEFARKAFNKGVCLLGGSSGTLPSHIKMMAGALRQAKAFANTENYISVEANANTMLKDNCVPRAQQSNWAKKISDNQFVICMELLPPKGLDCSKIVERSKICKQHNIDAINIPDCPRASARMSSLATACIIERDVGIETILHYACRDRNLLGIQSDLLGAAGLGIKNLLCVTGDPPKMGPYPNATAVFDIDAIGLVNMVSRLNTGYDLGGTSIGTPTSTSIGVGANPVAPDLEREKSRFKYKVEAGAQWAITQPVFDADSLFKFLDFSSKFKIPIIAGVWPLKSIRNAEFMANEIPGVTVPKSILERMHKCKTAEDQLEEGLVIAKELIEKIKSSVQGLQISAPLGMVDFALRILS
ncbi:MAG: bifunctional homocysteine S-methyltransferase/methylenetetrahydrofolate reductase [Bdellovibrionota bacterium]